jgi:hypothetical protein
VVAAERSRCQRGVHPSDPEHAPTQLHHRLRSLPFYHHSPERAHPRPQVSMDFALPQDAMEISSSQDSARRGVLQDAIFPAFGNDAGSPGAESPEQMQKNDPLGTQIWKLYSRAKTQLPNAERMENLTWRMMAMNMRRADMDRNKGYGCRHLLLRPYQRALLNQLLT